MDIRTIISVFLLKICNPSTLQPFSMLKLLIWDCFMEKALIYILDSSIDTNKPLPSHLFRPNICIKHKLHCSTNLEKFYTFCTRWFDSSSYNPVESKSDIHFLPLHQVFEVHGFKNGQKEEEEEEEEKSQFCHMNEKYQDTMVHIERVRQCDDVDIFFVPSYP